MRYVNNPIGITNRCIEVLYQTGESLTSEQLSVILGITGKMVTSSLYHSKNIDSEVENGRRRYRLAEHYIVERLALDAACESYLESVS